MPRVRYIGKTPKTDSIRGVGLPWEPGQERDVTATVAEHLLPYTDTWVVVGTEPDEDFSGGGLKSAKLDSGTPEPVDFLKDEPLTEEPIPVVDFHSMDRKDMQDYSMKHFGEKLDPKMSTENMRLRMYQRQGERNMSDQ